LWINSGLEFCYDPLTRADGHSLVQKPFARRRQCSVVGATQILILALSDGGAPWWQVGEVEQWIPAARQYVVNERDRLGDVSPPPRRANVDTGIPPSFVVLPVSLPLCVVHHASYFSM